MTRLSQAEIDSQLAKPHVAHLVSIRADGRPHVAPVWYAREGGRVWVMTGSGTAKARNIANNPAVSLSIAAPGRPYWYIVLEGEATLTTHNLESIVPNICTRYDGPIRGAEFARELLTDEDMVLIDFRIDRVVSWHDDEES
ncbi:MAG: PPOX class F420-dependent oxidoreductase [Chloroflexi bacterium]|nr:PPOX class F420-dependent oxidoreductase [Chloroflexota bacterium]